MRRQWGAIWPAFRTLIFLVLFPGTVAGLIPYWILGSPPTIADLLASGWAYLGAVPILLGAAIILWCAWHFAVTGRGTPAPFDPPRVLVVRGLYRRVRNPMYVGMLLILLGEAALFASRQLLSYGAFVFAAFFAFVLVYEEPTLKEKVGTAYNAYCREVPRWIPRLRPWVDATQPRSGSSPDAEN